ncbi:MAG: KpsF/GutQ family sugar-phosphate isomerase [Rickettsiaceae bacterium]
MNYTDVAKKSIKGQSKALLALADQLPEDFTPLVEYILKLRGRVILVGMGKSGYIAKKIAASLASTGTPAFYIHPGEASHGDLGMITEDDMVIMLSNSGETRELFDTINYCKRFNIKIAAITMRENSTLARNSDFLLKLPTQNETSASIAAPTTSAVMTLSIGDALVTVLHEAKGFTSEDFKLFHPGGKIGSNLLKVTDLMHKGDEVPIVTEDTKFTDVIVTITKKRLGCAIVLSKGDRLVGIITDGDLRRHIEDTLENKCAKDVMTKNPSAIDPNALASEALFIMNRHSITILPVTQDNKLIGAIHIHDILKAGVV